MFHRVIILVDVMVRWNPAKVLSLPFFFFLLLIYLFSVVAFNQWLKIIKRRWRLDIMKHERKKLDSLKAEVLSFASKQEGNLCKLKGNNTLFRLSSSALHAKRRLEKFMLFQCIYRARRPKLSKEPILHFSRWAKLSLPKIKKKKINGWRKLN
jgi:hypothetical protein